MGQLFSSEEELSQAKDAIGSILYDAMLEGGAIPDLGVVHPVLLANHNEGFATQASLQEQLKQLQGDIGSRAPTYLRDLIGRLSTFSDEPRLAGLVGLVVTMVMDMAYTSSKQPSGVKGRSAGSLSSQQRVWELQEVMEEYLKRCRISLSDKNKLIQDSIRLEAQLSLVLTQLKTCLLGGDCDSRSLRHWASGAAFHTQMLVHLAVLEGKAEPLSARAALEQYKEDLAQILPAYRRYKSNTISVVKCRGGLMEGCDASGEVSEDGNMTGITVTDRETGQSVTIPLSSMETETGRRRRDCEPDDASKTASSFMNLDLITSDQYAQAYLDRLFSDEGPVAELQSYFTKASENLNTLRCTNKKKLRNETEQSKGEHLKDQTEGTKAEQRVESRGRREDTEECRQRDESLKLSIVETQPEESFNHSQDDATSE
ncbi:uncharacterized protein LOC111571451 [Amphiprion ocellaris]|uniref:uncharacterized protein LOC111571451 n=1 Tax=Amphiprion ocellaris TaxID=80972 RepID=UPI002410EB37|nr:uncharacterized protein LOC111571451 [Amphiprion ocellaris]XP_023130378.2 uncharacterized protein LOC111571451 [Amphiprion ocellaris]XP_023130389.2 uncharacterized protein LOC111571451 [Amphiprion ocellaris]